MKSTLTSLAAIGLLVSLTSAAPVALVGAEAHAQTSGNEASVFVERGWITARGDNLCGLRDPNQLSNPAKLNYKRCLAATPEMKKMKADGIRPSSPRGIQLKNAAATRISTAASKIRKSGGFCSVWKNI